MVYLSCGDSWVSDKLILGLCIVQKFDCNRALCSVSVHAGFVMNKVVIGTAGLPVLVSPLLPTDLIKDWHIIRPEYQRTLYSYN